MILFFFGRALHQADFEEKAQRLNEETVAEMQRTGDGTPGGAAGGPPHADVVFECCWQKCDFMFDDVNELSEHLLNETTGHAVTTVNPNGSSALRLALTFQNVDDDRGADAEFQCMWRGCSRIRKGVPPFPKLERLLRHVKEVHILKNNGRVIPPADRSKYVTRRRTSPKLTQTISSAWILSSCSPRLSPPLPTSRFQGRNRCFFLLNISFRNYHGIKKVIRATPTVAQNASVAIATPPAPGKSNK